HFDPPYEESELQDFINNIELIMDDKITQIYLNGLYDDNSQPIINQFIAKNNLKISKYLKSFNLYPFKCLDLKYLKALKKEIKQDTQLQFKENILKKLDFKSDLLLIEKSFSENNKLAEINHKEI
ncbi:MAG: hypothetical protein ACFFE5_11150, partial [Candidatus Thorarchaeota archaeon]